MTEEEIEAVAHELAKVGGSTWYPGRSSGPILRAVGKRYKDRARVAIAALDRFRAARDAAALPNSAAPNQGNLSENSALEDKFQVGTIVVYRPPGDQRALSCRIEKIEAGRAYLVPIPHRPIGWVSLGSLEPLEP
ncbi:hypothetical protein DC522_14110 [Microvirga sp. KLBC 81]|nr:hypothetical protein DC522_14110 [Microvirga sp. KLBC 81]